ncbi:MAG: SOS response-associated peptidase family protein [Alphaproteobacteria bacterium]|nr:SOS response-associated peptidase family protein [Alphaproteobacteria bacterium]
MPRSTWARYNIAPTQQTPVVRLDAAGGRELVPMRWGLIPSWAKDATIDAKLINARADTVATKASARREIGADRRFPSFETLAALVPQDDAMD